MMDWDAALRHARDEYEHRGVQITAVHPDKLRKHKKEDGLFCPEILEDGTWKIRIWIGASKYQYRMVAALIHETGHADYYFEHDTRAKKRVQKQLPENQVLAFDVESECCAIDKQLRKCLELYDSGEPHSLRFSVNTIETRRNRAEPDPVYQAAFEMLDPKLWRECQKKGKMRS